MMEKDKNEIEFLQSDFTTRLSLSYAPGIKAGFPSPAEAYEVEVLDFNKDMIRHPDTTFYEPRNGDVVVAYYDNKFTVKFFDNSHIDEGYIDLVPANSAFDAIRITADDELTIWGVVQYTIKDWHHK